MLTTKHLPQSYTGQRFCKFFDHRFNFIKSSYSSTPEWITVSDYPIEHRNLWSAYQDPERLIGLSFGTKTHYGVLDIDHRSPYHPGNSESQYRELLGAYEEVGINSVLTVQSSNSRGLHIYFVFPKALPTFKLANMLRLTAVRAGYEVKDGKLEIFPNTKGYGKTYKTAYKPLRLPLQKGSYLLDKDYVPYSNDIEVFLNQAEAAAEEQDIELVEIAIESASQIKSFRRVKGDGDASDFARDLREQIAEGWTGLGQTNDLLRIMGTYGRVFKGLEGQALADYIVEKAEGSPGYWQYCQHKHNIQRRGKDWGRCIEKYYYPYGSEPIRSGTFKELHKSGNRPEKPAKENVVNQTRQEKALERIKQGMEYVRQTFEVLPTKVGELKNVLLEAIKQLFGIRTSDKTLARYRECWHPEHIKPAPPPSRESELSDNDQIGVITEKGKNRTLREKLVETEQDSQKVEPSPNAFATSRKCVRSEPIETDLDIKLLKEPSSNLSEQLIEQQANSELKSLEVLPRKASRLCPTPSEKYLKKEDVDKERKPLPDKASGVCAPPPSYMKVYLLNCQGVGLVSRRIHGRESSLKLISIPPNTKVRLCRGFKHSSHPDFLYIRPCHGAEDWVGGIAVLSSNLLPLDGS